MASLSTCHLGLWLGWQILLNLVKQRGQSHKNEVSSDSELCQTRSDLLAEAFGFTPQYANTWDKKLKNNTININVFTIVLFL